MTTPNTRTFSSSVLILLILAIVGCGGETRLKPLPKNAVILAFGDSLTFGTGVSKQQSYPSLLESSIGRTVINAGIPGEVSKDGLARLPGLLDKHRPALLILIHGGNDLLRRQSSKMTNDNLKAMVRQAQDRDIDVVMVGVPRPGLLLSPAGFYEEVANDTNTPIDLDAIADILQYPANKSDAVHPNAIGYRMLAESVETLIRDEGGLPQRYETGRE